ncbi:hypothetical protein QDT91_28450 (plasmid) [Mycolicibacterium aubagnense]|nr:hypothetical protein [Mycolicibacterium aubagnense]WGI35940.1 hypothetical protein QDT91_28450 [Mycolicibacterium aubagnense]
MHKAIAAVSMAAMAVVPVGACGSKPPVTWPGTIENHVDQVEFYDKQYSTTDIKVLCANAKGGGVQVQLTAPDGTRLITAQGADGAQTANITIDGPRGKETLPDGAVWSSANGQTSFILDTSGKYDKTFYMHDGSVSCPLTHA